MKMYFSKKRMAVVCLCSGLLLLNDSCRKKNQLPINDATLYKVLCDIQLAESAWDSESQSMKDSLSKLYYPQIFEHNGITSKDFDSTMHVLSDDPELMRDVYKEVIKEIQKHQPATDSKPTNAADSTNKPK